MVMTLTTMNSSMDRQPADSQSNMTTDRQLVTSMANWSTDRQPVNSWLLLLFHTIVRHPRGNMTMIHWPWCNLPVSVSRVGQSFLGVILASHIAYLVSHRKLLLIDFHILAIFVKADGRKQCSTCKEWKEPEFFPRNLAQKQCKACLALKQKIYSIKLESEYNIIIILEYLPFRHCCCSRIVSQLKFLSCLL